MMLMMMMMIADSLQSFDNYNNYLIHSSMLYCIVLYINM